VLIVYFLGLLILKVHRKLVNVVNLRDWQVLHSLRSDQINLHLQEELKERPDQINEEFEFIVGHLVGEG